MNMTGAVSLVIVLAFFTSVVSGNMKFIFTESRHLRHLNVGIILGHYLVFILYSCATIGCVVSYVKLILKGYEQQDKVKSLIEESKNGVFDTSIKEKSVTLDIVNKFEMPEKPLLRICLEIGAVGLMFLSRDFLQMQHLHIIHIGLVFPAGIQFALIVLLLELPFVLIWRLERENRNVVTQKLRNHAEQEFV